MTQSDFMDEIGDDLRRQELEKFWRENSSWIIGGIILAIVFTGALTFWRTYEYRQNLKATTEMLGAIDASDVGKMTDFAATADKNHAVIARLVAAGVLI